MNYSRRKFMKAGIVATAFAGIPLKVALAGQPFETSQKSLSGAQPNQLGYFNKSTFTPYVNTKFRVHLTSLSTVSVTLVKIQDLVESARKQTATGGECFSLRFTGPSTKAFGQQTYKMDHSSLGQFSMFLVPVSPRTGTDPLYYEAVINRRLQ